MKSFRLLGLAAALWSIWIIPAAAGMDNDGFGSRGRHSNIGSRNIKRPFPEQPRTTPLNFNRFVNGRHDRSGPFFFLDGGRGFFRDGDRFRDRDRDRRDRRDFDDGGGDFGGGWGWPYPYFIPSYDYTPGPYTRESNSPYQIPLNNGVNLSPLDPGYPGPAPAVGGYYNPYPPQRTTIPAPGSLTGVAPAPTGPDVDLVVGVQRELRRLGYYRGVVNGVSDARTRSAIRAYEERIGLPVTGIIGNVLVRSLGLF